MATTAIERKAAIKSIVVRFCANLFIKNRQNQNLRISFCVFTQPRPAVARQHLQFWVIIQTVAVQFGLLFFGVLRVVRGLVWRQYAALSSVLRVGGPQPARRLHNAAYSFGICIRLIMSEPDTPNIKVIG